MQRITMPMISKRSSNLIVNCHESIKYNSLYDHLLDSYRFEDAKTIFEHWNELHGDPVVCAHRCMALFEYCIEQESSSSKIKTLGRIISEGILPKVRDGNQTREYVKRKISRFKTKLHTKFNKRSEQMQNAVGNSIDRFNAAIQKTTKSSVASAQAAPKKNEAQKESAILEAFKMMEKVLDENTVCDTILNNQSRMSKRFNFPVIVADSSDIEDCVFKICECIDTYNMGLKHKYNVALQNIPYTLYSNGIPFEMSQVAESVTDYFLLSCTEPDIVTMQKVLEHNSLFLLDDKSKEKMSYMFKDIGKLDIKFDDTMTLIHEVDASKAIATISKGKDKATDMINDFKKSAEKTPDKLKGLITRIYTQPKDEIIEEYPNILGLIRQSVVLVGLGSLNPILAVVGLCADYAIELHFDRKQIEKYLDKQQKEIDKTKKKIDSAKTEESKQKLTKYKEALEKGRDKLRTYRDKLYTEEEAEKLRDKDMENDIDFDDDLDFDFDFEEGTQTIDIIATLLETIKEHVNVDTFVKRIYNNIHCLSESDINVITEYFLHYLDEKDWFKYFTEAIDPAYGYYLHKIINNECLEESKIDMYAKKQMFKDIMFEMYYPPEPVGVRETIIHLENILTIYNLINEYLDRVENESISLSEGSVKNNLKLASINLKNAIRGLSDKEKAVSRTIDASINTFSRGVERALTNDNREAVLRGSIIPSASKTIKAAIISGAAWANNPALAVIGALGGLAMSKQLQHKERQLILDEIEIELQMCEKYLRIAEEKNDMEATKQLLKTQRDLQRQHQRIKYRMKVYSNQVTKTGPGVGRDDDD